MRIGVFGGTFDPPHIGHLILAGECGFQLHLDRMLWVLTPNPPHKQTQAITPLETRLALVQAAIQDNPLFELCRVDIDRPGPHYAADTVHLLAKTYPADDLVYLIGGDSLHDLPGWHRPEDFLAVVTTLGVMRRPGDDIDLSVLEARLPGITGRIEFVTAPLLEISSSQIRHRAAIGLPYRYYLPPPVYQYIQSYQLYQPAGRSDG